MTGSTSTIGVRPAKPADLESIVTFNQQLAHESEGKDLDLALLRRGVMRVLEKQCDARYFVAEADGQIVGQSMLTYEWSDWRDGHFWWLQSVYVAAPYRKQGVFRALYDTISRLAQDDTGCCGLRLYVEHENAAAIRAYENKGMERIPFFLYEQLTPTEG